MKLQKNKSAIGLSNLSALILLLIFVVMALSLVFSRGVCCGDDAYFAIMAKNLAHGLGFTSTVQPFATHYIAQQFDPLIGPTPAIIFPAALFIKIFGNTYWAPGLSNVILWSSLLIIIGILLQRNNYGIGFVFFTFSFLYLAFTFMPIHFEHWYALLGEIPAALLIILAILCFFYRNSVLNQILTGLLFAFAVQAKFLALIGFLVFLIAHVLIYPREQPGEFTFSLKLYLKRLLNLGIGFSLPYIFFESWKFLILGPHNYVENWRGYFEYIRSDGATLDQSASLIVLLAERLSLLLDRFGILLPNVGFVLMLVWLMIKRDQTLKQLYVVLVLIIAAYSFWWIFFSTGRARYFIISLILLIFVISLPLLSRKPKLQLYLYFVLIILFTSNNWAQLKRPFEGLNGRYFSPTSNTRALLEVSKILNQNTYNDEGRIATEWWATAADIEYLMDDSLNFTTVWDKQLRNDDSFWVAANTRFTSQGEMNFMDLLKNCKDVQQIDVYVLAKCEQNVFVR